MLEITAAGFHFVARFEEEAALQTVAAFRTILPFVDSNLTLWQGAQPISFREL